MIAKAESVIFSAFAAMLSAFVWRQEKAENMVAKAESITLSAFATILLAFAAMLSAFLWRHAKAESMVATDECIRPLNNSFFHKSWKHGIC